MLRNIFPQLNLNISLKFIRKIREGHFPRLNDLWDSVFVKTKNGTKHAIERHYDQNEFDKDGS